MMEQSAPVQDGPGDGEALAAGQIHEIEDPVCLLVGPRVGARSREGS